MALTTYEPGMTMREARAKYFEVNGFGETGGYDNAWVDFDLGPIPLPFPNTQGRVRAVRFHDLHHVLTSYDTDIVGEFEISAWEIGAGCRDFYAAWLLNLSGLATGIIAAPRRVFRAFVRGRRSESLYGRNIDELLDQTVEQTRAQMKVDARIEAPTLGDFALFTASVISGAVTGLTFLALFLPLVPFGLVANGLKKSGALSAAKE